mmetsp:Transcript_15282/g.42265  ORF Transcript_15282/g.42265 Transcript_15282/m.42265 type:complete len:157 (-) Transcript_15282:15-485(-)
MCDDGSAVGLNPSCVTNLGPRCGAACTRTVLSRIFFGLSVRAKRPQQPTDNEELSLRSSFPLCARLRFDGRKTNLSPIRLRNHDVVNKDTRVVSVPPLLANHNSATKQDSILSPTCRIMNDSCLPTPSILAPTSRVKKPRARQQGVPEDRYSLQDR